MITKWLFGSFFVCTGIAHFVFADFFLRIMPPYIPWHLAMVYISGVFEAALGILLLIPKYTILAAWGLIALLIAVFPANIYMAVHSDEFADLFPAVALWIRLPIQGVLIAWAYWYTRKTS